eukprot:Skav227359  [mRNA]  locus=scaffold1121:46960:51265:- [translate_table: standard]
MQSRSGVLPPFGFGAAQERVRRKVTPGDVFATLDADQFAYADSDGSGLITQDMCETEGLTLLCFFFFIFFDAKVGAIMGSIDGGDDGVGDGAGEGGGEGEGGENRLASGGLSSEDRWRENQKMS